MGGTRNRDGIDCFYLNIPGRPLCDVPCVDLLQIFPIAEAEFGHHSFVFYYYDGYKRLYLDKPFIETFLATRTCGMLSGRSVHCFEYKPPEGYCEVDTGQRVHQVLDRSPLASIVNFTNKAFDKYEESDDVIKAFLARDDDSVDVTDAFTFGFCRFAKNVVIDADASNIYFYRFVYTKTAEDIRSLEIDFLTIKPAIKVRFGGRKVSTQFVVLVDEKHGANVIRLLRNSSLTKRRGLVEIALYDPEADVIITTQYENTAAFTTTFT